MHAFNKFLAGLAHQSDGGWELYAYNIAVDRVQFVPQVCLRDTRYLWVYTYSIEYILALTVLFRASLGTNHKTLLQKPSSNLIHPPRDWWIEDKTTQMGHLSLRCGIYIFC